MLVALMAWDKENALDLRMAHRPDHLAYLEETGIVRQAGPFLNAAEQPCGSLIVLEVDSLAEAEAWAAADPYAKAGLFRDVTLTQWKQVIGG